MNVLPRLQLLDSGQIQEIHRYSIRILEDTGIQVESRKALDIFRKSGGARIKNNLVFLSGELINHAINTAPSNIEVFSRSGQHAFDLGKNQGHETRFGIGATNTWFQGIEENQVELFTRQHMRHSTKLGDLLDNYDMISTPGIPSEASPDRAL